MSKSTWRALIASHMAEHGETWEDAEASTVATNPDSYVAPDERPAASFDREFGCGYGCVNGDSFTVWTKRRVYFPVVYDGAEWVGSAPRNPCDEACKHVGGQ